MAARRSRATLVYWHYANAVASILCKASRGMLTRQQFKRRASDDFMMPEVELLSPSECDDSVVRYYGNMR